MKVKLGDFICASLKKHKRWYNKKIDFHGGDALDFTLRITCVKTGEKPSLTWREIIGCYGDKQK